MKKVNMKRKASSVILSLVLVMILVAGCSNTEKATGNSEKSLVWGETQAVSSLDPAIDWQGWFTVRYAITETLFKLDKDLVPQPWLGQSYERVDEKTWKIQLKDNIKFSNGSLLTPDVVVENLKRVGSLNKRASILNEASYSVDGSSIIIKTFQPYPTLINDLCDPYSSIVDLKGTKDIKKMPIGTGPYVVTNFVEKTQIDMATNDNYWDGVPNVKIVHVKFVTDTDTLAMALQSGEVDVAMNITSDSRPTFENNKSFKIEEVATSRAYFMYYNLNTVEDINVRKAISMSIDKEGMKDYLFGGSVTPAVGAFPKQTPYGGDLLKGTSYDIDAAKKLLLDSGYKDSDGDGVLEKNGKPLNVRLVTYKRLKNEAIVTALQSKLKELGIQAEAQVHDNTEFFKTGDFDIAIYSIVTTPVGDPQAFLESTFKSEGITNYGDFNDEQVNALLDKLKNEFNSSNRANLAIQIQQKALEVYAFDNIGFVNMAMYMKSNVTGITPHPTDYYQINSKMDIE